MNALKHLFIIQFLYQEISAFTNVSIDRFDRLRLQKQKGFKLPLFMVVQDEASSSISTADAAVKMEGNLNDSKTEDDQEIAEVKNQLLALASETNRGFSANRQQQQRARELSKQLEKLNPTSEPLYPFYPENVAENLTLRESPSLAGKWTLVYTDAPDITGLDNQGPLPSAKLGRIGQECDPPNVKNVIEWLKPDWIKRLPFKFGEDGSRVLQKVCTEASVDPSKPLCADLKLVGVELIGEASNTSTNDDKDDMSANRLFQTPAEFLEKNPVELRGPLKAPFGKFDVLFLDKSMRIIKTYQGFLAVNVKQDVDNEWF